ncbi:MAG: hypothetical protein ACR2HX_02420 [Pyrinomonadaceae bacterium]
MANGDDIIIRGGSVELEYDSSVYAKNSNDPRKHQSSGKKITRIVITGDINFDSEDHPAGLKCEVRASCR